MPIFATIKSVFEDAISKMKFYVRQQHSSGHDNLMNSIDEGMQRITHMGCSAAVGIRSNTQNSFLMPALIAKILTTLYQT